MTEGEWKRQRARGTEEKEMRNKRKRRGQKEMTGGRKGN